MALSFERPFGVHADVKELEYISALHQTSFPLRSDGSIVFQDVSAYLMSRHSVRVSGGGTDADAVDDDATDAIMVELAGDPEEQPKYVIDMRQLTALLLIPHLARAAAAESDDGGAIIMSDEENGTNDNGEDVLGMGLFEAVLKIVQREIALKDSSTTTNKGDEKSGEDEKPAVLTMAVLRKILSAFGEFSVPSSLLQEMMDAAGGEGQPLTAQMFRKALTSDLSMWNPEWTTSLSTNFDDIESVRIAEQPVPKETALSVPAGDKNPKMMVGSGAHSKPETAVMEEVNAVEPFVVDDANMEADTEVETGLAGANDASHPDEKAIMMANDNDGLRKNATSAPRDLKMVYTMKHIDMVVDSFKSVPFMALLWVTFVTVYFAYMFGIEAAYGNVSCDTFRSIFVCRVVYGILSWTWIFIQLTIIGVPFFILGTLGMSSHENNTTRIVLKLTVAMLVVALVTIVPPSTFDASSDTQVVDTIFFNSELTTLDLGFFVIGAALGLILLLIQLFILVSTLLKKKGIVINYSKWNSLTTPSAVKKESRIKQAAAFKVNSMVQMALDMHKPSMAETLHLDSAIVPAGPSSAISSAQLQSLSQSLFGAPGLAMKHFQMTSDKKEVVGGFMWSWKAMWTGKITYEDGIWVHSRVLASNLMQVFVICVVLSTVLVTHFFVVNPAYDTVENLGTGSNRAYPFSRVSFFEEAQQQVVDGNASVVFLENYKTVILDKNVLGDVVSQALERAFRLERFNEVQFNEEGQWYYNSTGWYFLSPKADYPDLEPYEGRFESYPQVLLDSVPDGYLSPEDVSYQAFAATTLTSLDLFNIQDIESFYSFVNTTLTFVDRLIAPLTGNRTFDYVIERITAAEEASEDLVKSFVLTISKQEALIALYTGGLAGMCTVLATAVFYLPSFISSVLRFRSGVIPSLRGKNFDMYRKNGDQVTLLFGCAFWGCVFTGIATLVLVGGGFFLLVWNVTREIVIGLVGQLLGILVTLSFKVLILLVLRRVLVSAFYRVKPLGGNILYLVLEVWNIGITSGYMFVRTGILLGVTAMYLGRIDTPLLAPGVAEINGQDLDMYPIAFRKDLLKMDAHRHPYIETLGALYLLKLRCRGHFGTRAGGVWRLIFVCALMPWLSKYRADVRDEPTVNSQEDEVPEDENDVAKMVSRREKLEEELFRLSQRLTNIGTGKS